MVTNPALSHQCIQWFDDVARDWHDPFLAALAAQEYLRSRTVQLDIASIDANCFGDARTGACQERQQCSIATTTRRSLVRRVDKNIKFVLRIPVVASRSRRARSRMPGGVVTSPRSI